MYNSKFVDKYIEIIKSDEEKYYNDFLKFKNSVANSSAIYKNKPVPTTYQGLFYSQEDRKIFENMSSILMSITRKVTDEYLRNSEYRKLFEFSEELENLILHNPIYNVPVPIARYDVFYNGKENFKFCEFNTDGSSAMNEDNTIGELLLNTLAMKEFKKYYNVKNVDLFTPWVKESIGIYEKIYNKKPNIAIVDLLDIGTPHEFKKFKEKYNELGYNCEIIDIRDLKYKDGKLKKDDYAVDLVYRRIVTIEFMKHYNEFKDFIKAYYDNAFMMLGSFRSQLMHTKLIFKILREPATTKFLSDSENEFVKEHIPLTISLTEDTIDELVKNKNSYILKPIDDYASHGVYCGKDHCIEKWKEISQNALQKKYIYQEYYKMQPLQFVEFSEDRKLEINNFSAVLGMFIYNEKFIAPYTRIGKENTIGGNSSYYTAPNLLIECLT